MVLVPFPGILRSRHPASNALWRLNALRCRHFALRLQNVRGYKIAAIAKTEYIGRMRYEAALDTSGRDFRRFVAKGGYSLVQTTRRYSLEESLAVGGELSWGYLGRSGVVFKPVLSVPADRCKTAAEIEAWKEEQFTVYSPRDCAALHRAFARQESRAEEALQFVNRYGPIGGEFPYFDFLEDFYAAQKLIRDILELTKRPAANRNKVEEVINRSHVHFKLRVRVLPKNRLVQQLVPRSLLGWMLLQSVRELIGSTWRECAVCRTPFEVEDERQKHQKFCSARCRQKNFRDQRRG